MFGNVIATKFHITFSGFAFVASVRWLVCRQAMTQNPCYALVAVF